MTAAQYSAALDEAYRARTPAAVIFAVKQTIINQIRSLDPRVRVRTTEFFNHSFAPDLVLTWEQQRIERPLFVRQDVVDSEVEYDLSLMQRERPIIFGLEPSQLRRERLQRTEPDVRGFSTLITDSGGIGEIVERRKSNRVVDIAAPALLQGGRGVLDERAAGDVSTGLARGFVAAGNLAIDETRDAIRLIEFIFQPSAADRMVEFLRAVWIGAGGTSGNFPGAAHLEAGLTDEALRFLLEFEQNESLDFWRRVGVAVTLERIQALGVEPSRNLDSLIVANLDRISARACGVTGSEPNLLDTDDNVAGEWRQHSDSLAWRGQHLTIRFGATKDSVPSDQRSEGLPLSDLLARAESVGVPFESVELLTSARKIDYGLSDNAIGQDVTRDPQLRAMAESLGSGGLVRRAVASVPEAAPMTLDFATRVGSGRTAAKYSLVDLIRFAVPLLSPLGVGDAQRLRQMIEQNAALFEPPGLFEF